MALNLVVSVFVIFVIYYYLIHPCFVSTLSKIPNAHFSSPVSSVWIHWKRYCGKEVTAVNQAFRTKGPIVRLGPRDIALNVIEKGVKTVHGGGFEKPNWYTLWQNYGLVK